MSLWSSESKTSLLENSRKSLVAYTMFVGLDDAVFSLDVGMQKEGMLLLTNMF